MTKKRAKILRWRGVLDETTRMVRLMVAVILFVAGATFAFTQLGFADVALPNGSVAYVIALLEVVALAALLLGTLEGAVIGLLLGAVLYMHAQWLPLDHFELLFITPVTSIVMCGISGLLLGILFAFALRNNPSQVRRVVYIVIVCVIVSWLYSLALATSAFISLSIEILEGMGPSVSEAYVRQMAISAVIGMGDVGLQAWIDAALMALLCSLGDYASRKAKEHKDTLGLRTVFGVWLTIAVGLAFMTMSAVSFAAVSQHELDDAGEMMRGEVDYLCGQFADSDERIEVVIGLLEKDGLNFSELDDETSREIDNAFSERRLLNGYDPVSDGVVIVLLGEYVYASNDDGLEPGNLADEVFDEDMRRAVDLSIESGRMQRFVYGGAGGPPDQYDLEHEEKLHPQIAYLYAQRMEMSSSWDQDYIQDIIMLQPSGSVFKQRSTFMKWMTISEFVLLLAVFVIVFQLLDRVVARRIDEENAALARITAGDLNTLAEASGTREFDSLSDGINITVDALKGWISEAETRMATELATAKAIQESALPRIFPPFPNIMKFDIYASMNAAREVGGDFYDFFLIGDDCNERSGKLGFVVADVSGKGVPAALFMMRAKAQIRGYVGSGMELGEAITEANRQLCEGNDENMFVTAWVGVLDYGTGHIDYVNAGHNPPLIWQREGGWHWMRQHSGPMLGLFERPYRAYSVDCRAGDMLLLYTDGVTEAFDANENLYGESRLLDVAEACYRMHPRELLEAVRSDVAAYAVGAEQSDDITLLALEVGVPPEITAVLKVPAQLDQLDRVNDFLHAELDRRLCPQRAQNQLDIAVEELFVNVCNYAYANAESDDQELGTVRIQRTYNAEPASITVEIIDEGVPFDPLARPQSVMPTDIEDVPIGGLGILMAKKSVDEMRYERSDGCNVVTIIKTW